MLPILACPLCSTPPMISRPSCVRGVRSGLWFMVSGPHCFHVDPSALAPSSDDPDTLIAPWNEWATKEAAARSESAGHTPEKAAAFLAALQELRYSK